MGPWDGRKCSELEIHVTKLRTGISDKEVGEQDRRAVLGTRLRVWRPEAVANKELFGEEADYVYIACSLSGLLASTSALIFQLGFESHPPAPLNPRIGCPV